jgi:hypothetical protein
MGPLSFQRKTDYDSRAGNVAPVVDYLHRSTETLSSKPQFQKKKEDEEEKEKRFLKGRECSSTVEYLPVIHKALDLIPNTEKKRFKAHVNPGTLSPMFFLDR